MNQLVGIVLLLGLLACKGPVISNTPNQPIASRNGRIQFRFSDSNPKNYALVLYSPDKTDVKISMTGSWAPLDLSSKASGCAAVDPQIEKLFGGGQALVDQRLYPWHAGIPSYFATGRVSSSAKSRQFFFPETENPRLLEAEIVFQSEAAGFRVAIQKGATVDDKVLAHFVYWLSKLVLPRVLTIYGLPPQVDGSRMLTFFLADFSNKHIGGAFYVHDLLKVSFVRSGKQINSNHTNILYLNLRHQDKLVTTAAHELQHLLLFSQRALEDARAGKGIVLNDGLNEGLSYLVQDLTGSGIRLDLVNDFLREHQQFSLKHPRFEDHLQSGGLNDVRSQLMRWSFVSRGGNYLFLRYLFEQAGGGFFDQENRFHGSGLEFIRALAKTMRGAYRELGPSVYASVKNKMSSEAFYNNWLMTLINETVGGRDLNSAPFYQYMAQRYDSVTNSPAGVAIRCGAYYKSRKLIRTTGLEMSAGIPSSLQLLPLGARFFTFQVTTPGDFLVVSANKKAKIKANFVLLR